MSRAPRHALSFFALLVAMGAALPEAWAGDREDYVNENMLRSEPAKVVAACRRLADQGEAVAQFNLGMTYDTGRGVPQDYAEAARWYLKAADQGTASAPIQPWPTLRQWPGRAAELRRSNEVVPEGS